MIPLCCSLPVGVPVCSEEIGLARTDCSIQNSDCDKSCLTEGTQMLSSSTKPFANLEELILGMRGNNTALIALIISVPTHLRAGPHQDPQSNFSLTYP